jgi:ribosomal protein S18 acetylase RimI-like enzyme
LAFAISTEEVPHAMNIRRLIGSDAEVMYRLRLHALESEPKSFRESHEELRKVAVETYAARLGAGTDDNFVLGAFDGSELVGMVGFYRDLPLKCRHKGWIWGMFVDHSQRGKGIGRALLTAALERTRKLPGLTQVRLTVSVTQDAARKLYVRCGFRVFGVEPQAMSVNGEFVDEEQMVLPVST